MTGYIGNNHIPTPGFKNHTHTVTDIVDAGNDIKKNSNIISVTSNYTVQNIDDGKMIAVDASAGAVTITLPASTDGFDITVRKVDSSANAISVTTTDSETIDGSASITIDSQWAGAGLRGDGTGWHQYAAYRSSLGSLLAIVTFTSSGTYTKNTSASKIKVTVVGGGGGQGTASLPGGNYGGGGGGAYYASGYGGANGASGIVIVEEYA